MLLIRKGAYIQSGRIQRKVYVRPLADIPGVRGQLWLLIRLPYGITEVGRQFKKVIEQWLIEGAGFERVFGVRQLFLKSDTSGYIVMIVSKISDDILMGGHIGRMEDFANLIK